MAKATRKTPARRSKAYSDGLKVRRRWMGAQYVDRAFREADEFSIDLQHYVTEHGWGASWARGGLPLKTRSMMSLAMILALNRPRELEIHLRAALRNGITRAEIKELLLHSAVYCGAPAALDGFHVEAHPRGACARRADARQPRGGGAAARAEARRPGRARAAAEAVPGLRA